MLKRNLDLITRKKYFLPRPWLENVELVTIFFAFAEFQSVNESFSRYFLSFMLIFHDASKCSLSEIWPSIGQFLGLLVEISPFMLSASKSFITLSSERVKNVIGFLLLLNFPSKNCNLVLTAAWLISRKPICLSQIINSFSLIFMPYVTKKWSIFKPFESPQMRKFKRSVLKPWPLVFFLLPIPRSYTSLAARGRG